MTPMIWALVAVAVGIAIFAAAKVRARTTRAAERVHRVDEICVKDGHTYQPFNTGYRCARCGNHVSSSEGERYGRAEDGRQERRREPR